MMAIPEAQLDTWSKQGAVTQSKQPYASIKAALEESSAPYASKAYSVFLQGSYCNYTNVYAESDVDVVICLNEIFSFDLDDLTEVQKSDFDKAYLNASYTLSEFKNGVIEQLTKKYGLMVGSGTKAISITGTGNRRDADVLVAAQHRRY
jgi:hypothetical protein